MSRLSLYLVAALGTIVHGAAPGGGEASGLIDNNGRCFIAGDVVILQDTTGSFMDDMPIVRAQIPDLIERVGAEFPGTLFGIAEFRDKPYFPLGELTDFCYKLRYGELTNNAAMLQFAWDILEPSGGGDWYESQYQAGIDVVNDANVGWRPFVPGAYNITTKQAGDANALREAIEHWEAGEVTHSGARVVVLITDAEPHIPGDMGMCAPGVPGWEPTWYCPQNLPANPGVIVDDDFDAMCKDYDYPSEQQFVKAALDQNVLFVFLTTADVAPYYRRITTEQFKNPEDLTQVISDNSQNLTEALLKALKAISEVGCENFPTTTTTTTTTAATTTATESTTSTIETTTAAPTTTTPTASVSTAGTVATTTITATTNTSTTVVPSITATTNTSTTVVPSITATTNTSTTVVDTPSATTNTSTTVVDTTTTTDLDTDTSETTSTPVTQSVTPPPVTVAPTTAAPTGVPTPGPCPECPPCPVGPCPPCHCQPACVPPCDELVIKVGAQVAKLDLTYNN